MTIIVAAVLLGLMILFCTTAIERALCGCGLEFRRIANALGEKKPPGPVPAPAPESESLKRIASALEAIERGTSGR